MAMSALYDALGSAGAGDEIARKAADEVFGFEKRVKSGSKAVPIKWMAGFTLALTAAVLAKLLV